MVRQAQGLGNSVYFLDNAGAQRRAQSMAQSQLQRALDKECDAVPCPKCGTYQQNMMEKMCREHRIWMYWTGIGTIFVGVLLATLGYLLFELSDSRWLGLAVGGTAIIGIIVGVWFMIWRRQLADAFEPNDLPLEFRLAEGEKRATKVKNFKKWLEEQGIELQEETT
jgi:hypothetical protein